MPTPVLVVDAANVVAARPDGWWRDRRGATEWLLAELARVPTEGLDGVGSPVGDVVVVLEGRARDAAPDGVPGITLVRADGSGDDAIVAVVAARVDDGEVVTVVTSDRGLRRRVEALGAGVRGAGWLRDALDGGSGGSR
ncbi:MAG: hypothetical protein U0Q15_19990 [Kineosporiaceae bacterium]